MKAKILFHKCLQNAQELGSNDEFMVSRIFFSLQLPDKRIDDLSVDIKLAVGDQFEGGSIEVSKPQGYSGPLNYSAFRDAVEKYYRHLVGSTGIGIRSAGASNIRMYNNTFSIPMTAEIDIDESTAGW
ncbi:MAG TPA: hypothetical protein VFG09_15550 [Thermodesulfovibrionales bacterium]|nr:hypothetical protein [Thermodesulfovibrionales bacterium]